MSERDPSSWDDVVDKLQGAATELRSAAGRGAGASAEEEEAATRLKADVTRLEHSAAELRARLSASLESQKAEFQTSVDRDRAEQSAGQLKDAIDELAGLARTVTLDIKAAAETGFTQAQPELRTAIRALEDVAGSAGAWVRAAIDPDRPQAGERKGSQRPPLDDL